MDALQVPTLVVVHKEFLVDQWMKRVEQFLPDAKIGRVQQDECDYEGKHVVIGMVHSLAGKQYPSGLYRWPGLVIFDETHRVAAFTWSAVPPLFPARYRLGLSATPRRKDGADNVFLYHIGQVLFSAHEQRLAPKIRRVETSFSLFKTPSFNPNLASKAVLLKFLCGSPQRNRQIVDQLILAVLAGRKVLVLSERLSHLDALHLLLREMWPKSDPLPSVGNYVGGMKKEELEVSERCKVIFATTQMVSEGLDIPAIDTLFLTCPMGDVEQCVGRIQRPYPGKKEPVVVDFIDRKVPYCIRSSEYRQKFYVRKGWIT
jgi:superfamily II DNA or RNA helicase